MIEVHHTGPAVERAEEILTPAALDFLDDLHRTFDERRLALLAARAIRRAEITSAGGLDFLPSTERIRQGDWTVAPAPEDLLDRRVEITGPTERKMTINALNSGAQVWLADLEDANTPHWHNVVSGQVNLHDAVRGTISYRSDDGKEYRLRPHARLPTIVMRPRGWHLDERHLRSDGEPLAGALVDFGLYFFHNAAELIARGSGPYFYLPKLESHLEARLWNDVFAFAEERLSLPAGVVRATVLIETLPAAFEMEEILYELRERASGLNAGRWDYLFSLIKELHRCGEEYALPDRNSVTMTAPFLTAYAELLVSTCHRRGAYAIGGMAAFIPSRRNPAVNDAAIAKVRADKTREASMGFDGSWVAHPDLVPVCREIFDEALGERPHQLDRLRDDVLVTAKDLLDVGGAGGAMTAAGLRGNIEIALRYLESWLRGTGAVAIHNLMEDAATAEISRSQVWQWRHHGVTLDDGSQVTDELVTRILDEQSQAIRAEIGEAAWSASRFPLAASLLSDALLADELPDFLTVAAYAAIDR